MKKKVFMMLSCITAVAIATFVGTKALKPNVNDLLLQNVEALSQDGDSGMTCDNINGYKSWALKGFLKQKREFYDCCYKLQEGYSPEGNCRK